VPNGAICIVASYDFFVNRPSCCVTKPTTIAMTSVQEQLAHIKDRITLRVSWLHCCTPYQTRAQLLLYSIRV